MAGENLRLEMPLSIYCIDSISNHYIKPLTKSNIVIYITYFSVDIVVDATHESQ